MIGSGCMKNLQKIIRSVSMVGQIGISVVTPPLVFIYLARLACEKLGWGVWVVLVGILLGMVTAFCSVRSLLRRYFHFDRKDPPPPGGYNTHQ